MPSILNATTTNGLVTSADNSGSLQLQTNNGTTAVTIDTAQQVGIGVTPKTYSNGKALQINTASLNQDASGSFHITQNGYFNSSWKYIENGLAEKITYGSGIITFSNASNNTSGADAALTWSERMRITSGGSVLVNTTSPIFGVSNRFQVEGAIATKGYQGLAGTNGTSYSNVFNFNWTGNAQVWVDTTNLGTIQFSSDYRIKRNIETQTAQALERVMQLRPVTYQMADYGNLFKASDEIKEGFIAHEVQEVIPSGVDGEKDAENQIQSLRVDAILAVAVKAIQELKAELDATKAEVQALKGVA